MNSGVKEVLRAARAMLAGDLDILSGCRLICLHRGAIDPWVVDQPAMLAIRAVESETDWFPSRERMASLAGSTRERYEAELKDYMDRVRDGVMEACQELIVLLKEGGGCPPVS